MYTTLKQLFTIAAISFTLAFCTGLSASLIYQEHIALQTFQTAALLSAEASAGATLTAFDLP